MRSVDRRLRPSCILLVLLIIPLLPIGAFAQAEVAIVEPTLLSMFPLGGRRGTSVRVEVRGNLLEGSDSVWTDAGGLNARLVRLQEVKEEVQEKPNLLEKKPEKPLPVFHAEIALQIPVTAALGTHSLRLVGPRGISDALPFRVVDESVTVERPDAHQTIRQAQAAAVPGIINGKIEKPREVDYYSFKVTQGQVLSFEVVAAENCEPRLAVYRPGGSWFDPDRPMRLLFQEERSSDLIRNRTVGTFRAPSDGEYFLEVSTLFGKGTPGSSYQVRIASGQLSSWREFSLKKGGPRGTEHNFDRPLDGNWMASLTAREVPPGAVITTPSESSAVAGAPASSFEQHTTEPTPRLSRVTKYEAAQRPGGAAEISIPAVLEGTIGHPGQVQSFKFKAGAGQKLAFEIETPDSKPPYFNPRLGVVDGQDHEVFSNVERILSMFNNNADPQVYLNRVEPKATYTFEHPGEYLIQIRDITVRYGGPSFRYRILVRPEIPHVGEVSIAEGDRINLVQGESKKLTLTAAYEEGFTGDVSFNFSGLPEGVQVLPGVQFQDQQPTLEKTENADIIAPKKQKTTVVLVASPHAPLTPKPVVVELYCQPIINGKLGPRLSVRQLPLTVINTPQPERKETPQPRT
jgi:hypothetical protein